MPTRVALAAAARAGAVELLEEYGASTSPPLKLQVYGARPRSIAPPCAFVDGIDEQITEFAGYINQRIPTVAVIVVHGLFDSLEAASQRDAFVDGFYEWLADRPHALDPRTLVALREVQDMPAWVPEWMPPAMQTTFYATRLSLEGFAAT